MKVEYYVSWTEKEEDTRGWKNMDGSPYVNTWHKSKQFKTEEKANSCVLSMLWNKNITELSLTKTMIYK